MKNEPDVLGFSATIFILSAFTFISGIVEWIAGYKYWGNETVLSYIVGGLICGIPSAMYILKYIRNEV